MLTSCEMNSLDRSAFSAADGRCTSTSLMPRSCGGALDLGEAVGRRGIDAGDQLEVEHQEPAFRMTLQQRLDVLVEPVGRAEEQIALQVQALDLAAMRRQHRLIVARAIQRAAIFRAVETVFDGIDPRRAQRKGRAADHDADQDAGDEAPLHDDDDDRQQRQIFGERKPPPRFDDPFVELVRAEIDQQAAEHEFRHVAEQHRAPPPASAPKSRRRSGRKAGRCRRC